MLNRFRIYEVLFVNSVACLIRRRATIVDGVEFICGRRVVRPTAASVNRTSKCDLLNCQHEHQDTLARDSPNHIFS